MSILLWVIVIGAIVGMVNAKNGRRLWGAVRGAFSGLFGCLSLLLELLLFILLIVLLIGVVLFFLG